MIGFNLHWIYAHLIGDFLLQNDWMAANKKKNSMVCMVHVITYMIPFVFTAFNWQQLLLIAVQHYIQDRTNFVAWFCKLTKKFQDKSNQSLGYIIVDNVFHILWVAMIVQCFA
jgi:predicted hotdog family 3-hydroxylacyl-ACP dehydratase